MSHNRGYISSVAIGIKERQPRPSQVPTHMAASSSSVVGPYDHVAVDYSNIMVESVLCTPTKDKLRVGPAANDHHQRHERTFNRAMYLDEEYKPIKNQVFAWVDGAPMAVAVSYVGKQIYENWSHGTAQVMLRVAVKGLPTALWYTTTGQLRILAATSLAQARTFLDVYVGAIADIHNKSAHGVIEGCSRCVLCPGGLFAVSVPCVGRASCDWPVSGDRFGEEEQLQVLHPGGKVSNMVGAIRPRSPLMVRVDVTALYHAVQGLPRRQFRQVSASYEPDIPGHTGVVTCRFIYETGDDDPPSGSIASDPLPWKLSVGIQPDHAAMAQCCARLGVDHLTEPLHNLLNALFTHYAVPRLRDCLREWRRNYTPPQGKVTFRVFHSGSIITLGAKSSHIVNSAWRLLMPVVDQTCTILEGTMVTQPRPEKRKRKASGALDLGLTTGAPAERSLMRDPWGFDFT